MLDSEVIFYEFDNFRLDIEKEQLLENGQSVTLTHKAFQTLRILVQNFGQIVEKEDIYKELWSDSFVEESNLTQYIYLLRKILGNSPKGDSYIETVARRGYLFSGDVKVTRKAKAESALHTSPNIGFILRTPELQKEVESKEKEEQISAEAKNSRTRFIGRLLPVLSFGLIILLVTIGVIRYRQYNLSKDNNSIKTIAVLPFKPIGAENDNEKLDGFGMADAVITRLIRSNQIPVRSTSAIFQFTDIPTIDSSEAGRQLGVDAVLEGTLQRDGDRVRVAVKLIQVTDGKVLWAETYDEKFKNLFSLQDAISINVAQSLSRNLTRPPSQNYKRPTSNIDAYQAYLFGVYFWNKRGKEDLKKAAEEFQKAIDLDPSYAQAYAMLADTYGMTVYYGFADNSDEMLDKSQAAAEKALALDETVAEAHMAMAQVQFAKLNNFNAAVRSLERAIELNPYSSTIHIRYGWRLLGKGDLEGMVKQMRIAQEYEPLSPISNSTLCSALVYQDKFDEAVKYCEKAVEISPKLPSAKIALADVYFNSGRRDEALKQIKMHIEQVEDEKEKFDATGNLGFYYAKMSQTKDALEIMETLKARVEKQPRLYYDLLVINYALGRKDEGFEIFKYLYEKKMVPVMMYKYFPAWDEVKTDSRVIEMMKEQ